MNPNEVLAWREALVRLSDQYFFDLIRMYLGAVKTPFNKQRIVEDLSAFLRKRDNRAAILHSLDQFDRMVLSAVAELPSPTQQKIVSLFSGTKSFPEIYDRILNLEERLVVFRKNDTESREYALNPLLKDELLPLLGFSVLAAPESRGEPVSGAVPIDDLALASLYSFFLHAGESVKNDGSLKKKTREALEAAFPHFAELPSCSQFLLSAFQNLGLLVVFEGNLMPEPARWQAFARIAPFERTAWLVAAAAGRLPRDALQGRAQVFLDFFAALEPGARYRRETVSRLAFLLAERAGRSSGLRQYGRFASILRERASEARLGAEVSRDADDSSGSASGASESRAQGTAVAASGIADVAIAFGLLVETDGLWAKNSLATRAGVTGSTPSIVVSPSFGVTLMPGYTLAELLPLATCMEARDVQIVARFEITRRSCASAFEQGQSADAIVALLKSRSAQALPQNVLFSIDDWYRSYSSVSLYHGFVLRVDEGRRVLFENNEHLSALILKTLAPGVYLLDAGTPAIIQDAFAAAGLELPPSVSNIAPNREPMQLPPLSIAPDGDGLSAVAGTVRATSSVGASSRNASEQLRASLYAELDTLGFEPDVADALRSRIDRRIILTSSQLNPESVRVEKVEARGMDFLGKVRIAEYAITSGSLLEIAYDEKEGNRAILGRPVSTEKRTGDVYLKIVTEPDHALETVSIGKAVLVRRIRGSIFSELPFGRI